MSKKRRLGRGLAELLAVDPDPQHEKAPADTGTPNLKIADTPAPARPSELEQPQEGDLLELAVDQIQDNPFQPRRMFHEAEIASLAESLKAHDILQPILVRRVGDQYQLISGERRLRAAIKAGWSTIPARLRTADDRLVAELAIVENLQRKDLNPIEKALSFRRYLDQHKCTQEDLAGRLKIDRSTIANLMRLLELPNPVLDAIRNEKISAGHARALLPLDNDGQQVDFCKRIQKEALSVRDTEELVQQTILEEDGTPASSQTTRRSKHRDHQLANLEQELRMALGTKVDIRLSRSGRGRLVIHFSNNDEFERIRTMLHGDPSSTINRRAG
ncbi:MAG: ParB/RepB/Spo0J family partition protein [Planctomycetota bacterium]|nr:ParB/RepB/Spo0J family partition protein [Planctomycetota bacterium]MEE2989877.1 ParB/RepB/Spo0J family partition protein [Planctomycetota bacterium]